MTPEQTERLIAALERIAQAMEQPQRVVHSWPIGNGHPPPQYVSPVGPQYPQFYLPTSVPPRMDIRG